MSSESFDFSDYQLVTIPVRIGDTAYILRQASGDAAVKYRDRVMSCTTFGKDGAATGVKGIAGVEPYLVSLCLFEVSEGKEKAVLEQTVRSWPNPLMKKLYDKARAISGMEEVDQTRVLLAKALSLPSSPVALAALQDYIEGLDSAEFKTLQRWLGKTTEEEVRD